MLQSVKRHANNRFFFTDYPPSFAHFLVNRCARISQSSNLHNALRDCAPYHSGWKFVDVRREPSRTPVECGWEDGPSGPPPCALEIASGTRERCIRDHPVLGSSGHSNRSKIGNGEGAAGSVSGQI